MLSTCPYNARITVYYIDTDIYARFFSCEKPFRDMFLTNVIQSESWNDFFTRAKTFRPISARLCLHSSEFVHGRQSFRRYFFKLLAVSCGLKSILNLKSTRWAISYVFKDLQYYKNQKCIFGREICKQKARQLYQNKQLGKLHLYYIHFLRFLKDRLCIVFFIYLKEKLKTADLFWVSTLNY